MLAFYLSLIDSEEEKDLFEQLYREHREKLANIAYGILRDKSLAEDAVHDTFMILVNNMDKISDKSCNQKRNYLIIIVRNLALKKYNKRKKEFCADETVIDDEVDLSNVEIEIENKEKQEKLIKIIKKLDPKYGDVLMLRYYHDMQNKKIAKKLGISEDNVKARLFRGKKKLKEIISEDDAYDECGI